MVENLILLRLLHSLVLPHLKHRVFKGKPVRILELGSWEGRSTCWLLQNVFKVEGDRANGQDMHSGSRVVCVDHFDLLRTDAGRARRAALEHNLLLTGHR